MDLIGELIQNKQTDAPLPIKEVLTELIQYEKLSRKDQFKHLADNPMLQKKLPYCWQAFEGSSRMHWLLSELSTIMQTISERELEIFSDLAKHYSKRKQKQMNIIGNAIQYRFNYRTLRGLPHRFDYNNALYLTDERNDNEIHTAILSINEKDINVYIGVLRATGDEEDDDILESLDPFTYTKDENTITIPTYSIQGNNDYPFAYTQYHHISMPDSSTICYTSKQDPSTQTHVELGRSAIQKLAFNSGELSILADILLTYEPEPDEKTILRQKLQNKRVNTHED